MAWNKVVYSTEEEIMNSLSDLVTVASKTVSGDGDIQGTAFPISVINGFTLMLTALHVIEEGFIKSSAHSESKNARRLTHIPSPDNTLYNEINNWVNSKNEIWCLLTEGTNLVQCNIIGVCLRPPLDIALLVVDTLHMESPTAVFQINSDLLSVGEEILITSFITKAGNRDLIARHGKVTSVDSTGRLVDAPVYKTNIPIEPGASGGPVFKYTGNQGPKEVVGVITSDLSVKESFNDPNVDGDSTVSIICTACPLEIQHTDGTLYRFQDLKNAGLILDVGSYLDKVELIYNEDKTWLQKFP